MRELWSRTFQPGLARLRPCPSCHRPMQEVPVTLPQAAQHLDVCRPCQFVWFDPSEFEVMPPRPPKPVVIDRTPQAVKEAVAIAQVERMGRELADAEPDLTDLRNVPALLGFPVETEQGDYRQTPWLTWSVALLVAIVSVFAFRHDSLTEQFALVPATAWRLGGLTLLTSFFLHGGLWHLLGNLYFLVVFGDNVEEFLGRWRWLSLVIASTVVGGLFHLMANPHDPTPCVGASGGISGLLAFYAFRFPRARLGMRIWMRYSYRAPWITFPAWGGFAVWIGLQLFGVLQQVSGFSHVSSLAHLGGAIVGIAAWLLWRRIEVPPELLPRAEAGEAPPRRPKQT